MGTSEEGLRLGAGPTRRQVAENLLHGGDHFGLQRAVARVDLVAKSDRVLDKIACKHDGITSWEVDEAVVRTLVEKSWWVHDDERGWRLKVAGRTAAGRRLLVVLYPVDEDEGIWRLGTAIRDD